MPRSVHITNRHRRLRLSRHAIARAIAVLDEHAVKFQGGCPPGELSLVFLTDAALAKIHGDFMDDPTATDVITFAGDPAAGLAGEICVSADTAARYVGLMEGPAPAGPRPSRSWALQKTRLAAPGTRGPELVERRTRALQDKFSTELTLYLVHGWLHLAGYDDLQPAKKRRMRAAETRATTLLREADAVPGFRLVRP